VAATLATALFSTGNIGTGRERDYVAVYRVITTSRSDGPITARNAPGIPPYGSSYVFGNDSDAGSFAVSADAQLENRTASNKVWLVTVRFSSKPQNDDDPNETDNPLDKPVRWSGSFAQFTAPVTEDRFGLPILNSARMPYDTPPNRDDSRPTIIAEKNFASLDLTTWREYADVVNSDVWLGFQPREVKVANITWDERFRGPLRYFSVRFTFHLKPARLGVDDRRWDHRLIDRGYFELNAAGDNVVRITDDEGRDLAQPALLDGVGSKIPQQLVALGVNFKLEFQVYEEKPFAQLGLPAQV
jgi:hypothetical protein